MADDTNDLAHAVAIEQIVLRALLVEFVTQHTKASKNPEESRRELLNGLYEFIDHHRVPGADGEALEVLKEKARGQIDVLLGVRRSL